MSEALVALSLIAARRQGMLCLQSTIRDPQKMEASAIEQSFAWKSSGMYEGGSTEKLRRSCGAMTGSPLSIVLFSVAI